MIRRTTALAVLAALLLGGCGNTPKDNALVPRELSTIAQEQVVFQRVWSTSLATADKSIRGEALRPAVAGTRVFLAGGKGDLEAVELETGRRLWRTRVDARLSSGPASDGRRVVVGSLEGVLYAFDANDGEALWSRALSGEILAAASFADEAIVVHAVDGRVYALEARDGSQRWGYSREVPLLTLRGTGAPIVDEQAVYVGTADGRVVALGLSDGRVRWEQQIGSNEGRNELERLFDVDGVLVLDRGDLYASSYNGETMALTADAGRPLWSHRSPSWVGGTAAERQLIVADAGGNVWSLERRSGTPQWKQDAFENRQLTTPAVVGDQVVVGDAQGYLHALSLEDGRLTGRTRLDRSGLRSGPVVAGPFLIAQSKAGDVAAYRLVAR